MDNNFNNNFNKPTNNKENNMNNMNDMLEVRLAETLRLLEEQRRANEDYRSDVRFNVLSIAEVLHGHARDCDDQALIDGLIEQINLATSSGFPELRKCTRNYELTITYTVEVEAANEEDARIKFDDGDYDHLINLSDYYEFDVEEGC